MDKTAESGNGGQETHEPGVQQSRVTNVCKVCSAPTIVIGRGLVLAKYDVGYHKCVACGFVQPDAPHWLDEAYSNVITNSDLGLVQRNMFLSKLTAAIIHTHFDAGGRFIDFGGGYGLFVRMMRDLGLNFYRYDKFCPNLFAQRFEVDLEDRGVYNLVCAFEVFEHLVDPMTEIDQMLKFSRNILFSTTLVPQKTPPVDEWWYYGLEHGQHVSLYSRESLQVIAERAGLRLYTNGVDLHLLTEKKISERVFNIVCRYRAARVINKLSARKSLLGDDYFMVTGKRLL
ncbi:MAG: hypothetical protein NVS2B7_37780 [Herpetosiphon sp.]